MNSLLLRRFAWRARRREATGDEREGPREGERIGGERLPENVSISWQICRFLVTGLFDGFIRFQSGLFKRYCVVDDVTAIRIEICCYVTKRRIHNLALWLETAWKEVEETYEDSFELQELKESFDDRVNYNR